MKITPGTLFRAKVRFYDNADAAMPPGEIFMYLESETLEEPLAWSRWRHKFLSKDGRIIWWNWKDDIEDFVEWMGTMHYLIERVEISP